MNHPNPTAPKVTIQDFMRVMPFTIGSDIDVGEALRRMREHRIRHLPVLQGGKLVGLVSERDLNLVRRLPDGLKHVVSEVMADEAYTVSPDADLAEVVAEMVKQRYGAALVTGEKGEVKGIFTAIDAMQVLHEALKFGRIP